MDLLSLLLTLRPLTPPDPTRMLPAWWGRAAHSLLLDVVRQSDPPLAEALHEAPSGENQAGLDGPAASLPAIRPFTVSSLLGRFPHGALDPALTYTLRLTAFQKDVAAILSQAAQTGPLAPGAALDLDYLPFRIEQNSLASSIPNPQSSIENSQTAIPHPQSYWSASTTYADLSAALLLAKTPAPRRISLLFTSPTTFKSGGKHVPVPLPELVFGSLLERWNAYAPIAFPPETRRYAAECLAVSAYQLSTRPVPMKSGGLRVGAVGEITYTSVNYDRYWMSVAGVLAAFALFSGVGAGTSMGLGQCRQVTAALADPAG
jgi:CRISPR-associated endoribonuclease Cas6